MKTTNNTSSAAHCIRTVAKHYGIRAGNIPYAHNADGIIQILKSLDFYACDLHTNTRGLIDCPKPAIVQTITDFVTLLDANKISVKIMYGDHEVHRIPFLDFVKIWTGLVILIEPPPTRKWSFLKRIFD